MSSRATVTKHTLEYDTQEIKNASTNDGFFDNIEDEIPF